MLSLNLLARRPNNFTGAKGCEKFKQYLESHGGKLPETYEGALEKFLREKRAAMGKPAAGRTTSLTDLEDESDYTESEFSEAESSGLPSEPRARHPGCTAFTPVVQSAERSRTKDDDKPSEPSTKPVVAPEPVPSAAGDSDADDEDVHASFQSWAHNVRSAGQSKQRKLKKVSQRIRVWSDQDIMMLENMIAASVDYNVPPPPAVAGKKWSMVDSGSQPTVADCEKEFPHHRVHPSAGSKSGLKYKAANGELIDNLGEVHIRHLESDGTIYNFTFQHAKVHCPIVSVRELVSRDCSVTFHKYGGRIQYPSGKKIRFVLKGGVFFVLLNVLPPGTKDCLGNELTPVFSRHGRS